MAALKNIIFQCLILKNKKQLFLIYYYYYLCGVHILQEKCCIYEMHEIIITNWKDYGNRDTIN